jgi:hypothetical protein
MAAMSAMSAMSANILEIAFLLSKTVRFFH